MAKLLEKLNPRKRVTGTSLEAQGALPPPSVAELGSQNEAPLPEVVPELGNRQVATRTYRRMVRNDASVSVSLRAAKAPVQNGQYFIEPYSDEQEDRDIRDFVHYNIFHGTSYPFLVTMEEILRFYENGFSVLEKVFELREWAPSRTMANRRKYTMLKKLAPRPASSIKQFNYDDNGGPISVTHNKLDAKGKLTEVEIPIEKLVIFTLNKTGGNLEGESILRTAYKHWFYKDRLYKIDAIQKERHGIGIPDVELPIGATDKDKEAARELVRNLRTNEQAGIVRPQGMNVGFAKIEGNVVNALESAEHHDGMIMKNIFVQFMNLGLEGTGGGRATSGSHFDMFLKALRFVANSVCEHFNMYVIPQLVAYNYDTDKFPRMQVRRLGETKDLQMFASALANMVDKNIITMNEDTENWVRGEVDMPALIGPRPTVTDKPQIDAPASGDGNGKVSTVSNQIKTGTVGKSDSSAV